MFFDSPLHGYYIHGYNPSKRSDTNLHGLMNILKEESNDKSQKRGLESGHNDPSIASLQTFEIFVDCKMRRHYDDVSQPHARFSSRYRLSTVTRKKTRKKR